LPSHVAFDTLNPASTTDWDFDPKVDPKVSLQDFYHNYYARNPIDMFSHHQLLKMMNFHRFPMTNYEDNLYGGGGDDVKANAKNKGALKIQHPEWEVCMPTTPVVADMYILCKPRKGKCIIQVELIPRWGRPLIRMEFRPRLPIPLMVV